jgi:hypothetical protein
VALLDTERVATRRKRSFAFLKAKGVPDELAVYSVSPNHK